MVLLRGKLKLQMRQHRGAATTCTQTHTPPGFCGDRLTHALASAACVCRVGNILFSVETQTTEERTQLYHAEIDALYKDLTAKGKVLILSSEFGVGFALSPFPFLGVCVRYMYTCLC